MTDKVKQPAKTTAATASQATAVPDVSKVEAVKKSVAKVVKTPAVKATVVKADNVTPVALSSKDKGEKHKKEKMVRDSFSMPQSDYAQLAAIKARCLQSGVSAKKSEVLRAALKCLTNLSDLELTKAITDLDVIKSGRPSKD